MSKAQATDRMTVREFFKTLLFNAYPCDLKSPNLVGTMSQILNLTYFQVRKAIYELEQRKFIEVVRDGCEVLKVEVLNRNWQRAPKIPL